MCPKARVLVGGKDVRSYDLDTLRNEVSVVLQNNVLFSGTIYENLRWGDANADRRRMPSRLQTCLRRRIYRAFSGWLQHLHRAGRNQCLRRSEAASVYRPRAVKEAEDPDSRRQHQRSGHGNRCKDPSRPLPTEIPNTTKLIIAQRISYVSGCRPHHCAGQRTV